MNLIASMAKSDAINECEKHQKKTLKQIKDLILQIVKKRKDREISKDGTVISVNPLSKPPDLKDVRRDTMKNNLTSAYRMLAEIYPKNNSHSRPV